MKLDTKISIIPGVGPKIQTKLERLKIITIKDLIEHYPRTYIDLTDPKPISSYRIGNLAVIKAKVIDIEQTISYKKRISITRATLEDDFGNKTIATWYNQTFIKNNLAKNSTWLFYGNIAYDYSLKIKSLQSPIYTKKPEILSIYPETEGVNSKFFRKIIAYALDKINISETLPIHIIKNENFFSRSEALQKIHFPKTQSDIAKAKKRLSFEEFYHLSYKIFSKRKQYKSHRAYKINIQKSLFTSFVKKLPYELTGSQQKAIYDIYHDLAKDSPMTRLINGDVGSGKTIVATLACYMACANKYRCVWMAPTEILATQHFQTLCDLFKNTDISIGLLTANKKDININSQGLHRSKKLQNKKNIKNKSHVTCYMLRDVLDCDIIIGTHSLIQDNIVIDKLALVVVDEEHRFGVKQRAKLITLNSDKKHIPHYLSMTATPIPRTLAISLYADLDICVIDQMPKGRKPVITRFVNPSNRKVAYEFIRKHLSKKRQVFVICPLIQQTISDKQFPTNNSQQATDNLKLFDIEKKSVIAEYHKLSKNEFRDFKVACLHGKMKSAKKEKIMRDFAQNKIDVLVSTSVVEVGVNIPNASIMIIEDAERFGLAQLHQFRGRVGRGVYQSFCLLFSNAVDPMAIKRLHAIEGKNNGFELAEIDLTHRGPGEFIGSRQSGFLSLKIARIFDIITLNLAKKYAKKELENSIK